PACTKNRRDRRLPLGTGRRERGKQPSGPPASQPTHDSSYAPPKRVTPKAPERLGNCSSCPLSFIGRFCGLFLPGGGTHHTAPAAISAGFPAFGKTCVATPSRMAATPMPPAVQIEIKPRLPPF